MVGTAYLLYARRSTRLAPHMNRSQNLNPGVLEKSGIPPFHIPFPSTLWESSRDPVFDGGQPPCGVLWFDRRGVVRRVREWRRRWCFDRGQCIGSIVIRAGVGNRLVDL